MRPSKCRLVLSWLLYIAGDIVSRVMNYWPSEHFHPYNLYNWLMGKSSDMQGWGKGPWGPIYDKDNPPPREDV